MCLLVYWWKDCCRRPWRLCQRCFTSLSYIKEAKRGETQSTLYTEHHRTISYTLWIYIIQLYHTTTTRSKLIDINQISNILQLVQHTTKKTQKPKQKPKQTTKPKHKISLSKPKKHKKTPPKPTTRHLQHLLGPRTRWWHPLSGRSFISLCFPGVSWFSYWFRSISACVFGFSMLCPTQSRWILLASSFQFQDFQVVFVQLCLFWGCNTRGSPYKLTTASKESNKWPSKDTNISKDSPSRDTRNKITCDMSHDVLYNQQLVDSRQIISPPAHSPSFKPQGRHHLLPNGRGVSQNLFKKATFRLGMPGWPSYGL